ncbi:MAG: hypothetical protein KME60_27765 [Cyanomargarita calcarea GSE-NOS-MK-12-04C]|jgi:hypothetical protein|uniref:DUF4280 domain-containing protein n=1 Tax=Cyanomargarita calcarea GSE-NOS-MK-12-04C TaxID=2839659 RepID=A0A951QSD1_9CYAN|nr:hypothetical protein [Cyanomargarita calcarea GSE-NOS-MK-12-04C]
MPGNHLTTSSQIMCPHGGQAILFTSNTQANAVSTPVLLESDIHPVAGCPFTVGPKYSPCVRIEWSAGSSKTSVNGTATLVQSSIGKCINAEGAPQGIAIVVNTQPKASAL